MASVTQSRNLEGLRCHSELMGRDSRPPLHESSARNLGCTSLSASRENSGVATKKTSTERLILAGTWQQRFTLSAASFVSAQDHNTNSITVSKVIFLHMRWSIAEALMNAAPGADYHSI